MQDTIPTLFIDVHSYSQVVIWPYGYTDQDAKTHSELEEAAVKAQAEMRTGQLFKIALWTSFLNNMQANVPILIAISW